MSSDPEFDPCFERARASDWDELWPIVRDVLATGDTYALAPATSEKDARAALLFDGTQRRTTYVARLGGRVVGLAYLKPNQPGLGDHVANAGWMIAPSAAGRGIGRAFARYVLDEARREGFRAMQFNAVVATNERALRLWTSLGFEIVGTIPGAFRHARRGRVAVHVMHREL